MKQLVKNLLTALYTAQMKQIIKKHKPQIVAVVGSVGKTSTKYAIATVLSEKYRVLVQHGNYNAPISVPFIFFERPLPSLHNPFGWLAAWWAGERRIHGAFNYDVVVVELGTDKPGDIAAFKESLQPDLSVITAVSPEHMEFFQTIDAVAKEELSVASFSKAVLINSDDVDESFVAEYLSAVAKIHTYGGQSDEYTFSSSEKTITITLGANGEQRTVLTNVVAHHSQKTLVAAAATASLLGLEPDQIASGIIKVTPPPGRMQLLPGIKNSTIIDDSYNASPLAVKAALATLYTFSAPQRIALLGNMNELGETSEREHVAIGNLCDPKQVHLVITLGADANKFTAATVEANGCKVVRATSPYEAGKIIADNLQEGAAILVKGSQNGVFSEEAIKSLLQNPQDVSKLVRQSEAWLAKKRAQFNDAA